jgi:glycerol-3-phosphate O-acyltransferase
MEPGHEFDDIRPYRDEEIPEVMDRLVKDPVFEKALSNLYKSKEAVEKVKYLLSRTCMVDDFQTNFMVPYLENIIRTSTTGVTVGGLGNLDKEKSYLFISNHRDIILDAALLNYEIHKSGLRTTEIAIGSNLLIRQWITDLVKLNRAFVVKRNIPVKQMLEASKNLSDYIRHTITNNGDSIWIAQREGRTKNGDDKTQSAVLKMLNMSNGGTFEKGFNELNIIPLSISYEVEPCGNEKVAELLMRQSNPDFKKSEQDDLWNMVSGLNNQKGRIHFQFGQPIEGLDAMGASGNKNVALKKLAECVDNCIYENYRLWPNNYIAYDELNETDKYKNNYTESDKKAFLGLTHERLQLVHADRADAMELWLKMYSAPVDNFENPNCTDV